MGSNSLMRNAINSIFMCLGLGASACVGNLGGFGSASIELPSETGPAYKSQTLADLKNSCEVTKENLEPTPLRRLTTSEYTRTVVDVFQCQYNCWYHNGQGVEPLFRALPAEPLRDSIATYIRFSNLDQSMTPERIAGYHKVALAVSENVSNGGLGYTQFYLDPCYGGAATITPDCRQKLMKSLALKLYRRPISTSSYQDLEQTMGTTGTWPEQFKRGIYYLLMSPEFLYHFEADGPVENGIVTLDQYALASKMSFLLRGRGPDKELLARAATDQLKTPAQIDSALEYIRSTYTQQVKDQMWTFIGEWLAVPTANFVNDAKFVAIANGAYNAGDGNVNRQLREDMNTELRDMFEYFIFTTPGTYKDLLTNESSFAKSPIVAGFYGLNVWDGTSAPLTHKPFERAGFLTTSALLARGTSNQNPFRSGGLFYKHILCRTFETAAEPLNQPSLDPSDDLKLMTTRERYEKMVPRTSSCMNCHTPLESFGMGFQDYDAFGRHRKGYERIFDSSGTLIGSKAVDTYKVANVNNQSILLRSGVDAVQQVAATTEPQACFAKQYIRFANARLDNSRDACITKRFTENLTKMSVWNAIKAYIADESFSKRRIQ